MNTTQELINMSTESEIAGPRASYDAIFEVKRQYSPRKPFTAQDLKLLKEFLESGKSVNYIAVHFGKSLENIRMKMSELGLYVKSKETGKTKWKQRIEDISTRIRILKGEELRISTPNQFFSDEQLNRWKDNTKECCDLFCKEVLNITLQDYQVDIIGKMLNHRRFVGVLGRQSGKDFLLSCFVVWQSVINSNSKILLVRLCHLRLRLLS